MKLTNINEVDYNLSMDFKLVNICISTSGHRTKHTCPYGECYKDSNKNWVKGCDRTIRNIQEHRKEWLSKSRKLTGTKSTLKYHMNCENIPILDGDPDDPIYLTIPPPPLHTILLGPVNHVFKELRKRHPVIMKTIDNLHIQQSKYHGKNFEGNQCRAILKSVHKLNIPKELVEFKNAFIAIKNFVS